MPNRAACKHCRYPLHGLDMPRCPECGQPFDPENPSTFVWDAKRVVRRHDVLRASLAGVIVVGLAVIGVLHKAPACNPLCGPLLLVQSPVAGLYDLGLLLTVLLSLAFTAPLLRAHFGTVLLAILGVLSWLALGVTVSCVEIGLAV